MKPREHAREPRGTGLGRGGAWAALGPGSLGLFLGERQWAELSEQGATVECVPDTSLFSAVGCWLPHCTSEEAVAGRHLDACMG